MNYEARTPDMTRTLTRRRS